MQVIAIDHNVFQRLIQQQLFHGFAAQFGRSHAPGYARPLHGVVTDNADNGAILNRQLAFLQRVTLDLFRQQVLFSNVQLLVFGITGQTNHFHTIQQRRRNVQWSWRWQQTSRR